MITLLTNVLVFLQITIIIGLYILLRHLWPVTSIPLAWGLSISVVVLARFMLIANTFLIAYRHRSPLPAEQRLSAKTAIRVVFQEFWVSMLLTSWHMPFRSFPCAAIAPETIGLPVLLIHGYGCNSGYWHSMRRRLTQAHISHTAVDLEPLLGDIDEYATSIEKAVEHLCRETGQAQIIILAHSMGGLAARAYLRRYGNRRIAKIITIGTPHHGTVLAKAGIGINSLQMQWYGTADHGQPSDWLRNLSDSEVVAARALITSIYSLHDNIVAPQLSCQLSGAKNIVMSGIGHMALGRNPTVQALVLEEIRQATDRC